MTQFVTNIIQNSLSGFVSGAVSTAGGYAGDAIAGLGNFVEKAGDAAGNGVANKFDSWGQGISAYGGAKPKPTASRTIASTEKKSTIGTKKALPVAPSTQRKALTAPPPKAGSTVTKQAVAVKANKPQYPRANSASTVVPRTKKATASAKPAANLAKPKTNASGKVIMQKQSMPQSKTKAFPTSTSTRIGATGSKGPLPDGGDKAAGKEFKPHGGYGGPLNLGGLDSGAPKPAGQGVSASSNQYKGSSSGYQGPLGLGGGVSSGNTSSSYKPVLSKAAPSPAKPGPGGYGGPLSLGSLG